MSRRPLFLASFTAALTLVACSSSHAIPTGANGSSNSGTIKVSPLSAKIKHVIVVILENRSFDNIFAADTELASMKNGPVNVDSSHVCTTCAKPAPTIGPVSLSASYYDEDHSHQAFLQDDADGKDDGWPTGSESPYGYVPADEAQIYYDIAAEEGISDTFFHSTTGPTFPSHLHIGAGTTFGIIDNPSDEAWGCDAAPGTTTGIYDPNAPGQEDPTGGPYPCFDDLSIFDLMDRANVSWRYYVAPEGDDITGELNIASYFRHIRFGPDWNNDIATTDAEILTDITTGNLRQVSFLIPNDASTDHAGYPSLGPTYIKTLVNTLGESSYYNDTLMIVTWDDWGGWYDHVPPPMRANGTQLSFRKPILLIGGYVKHNYCSHVQTEDASIPKTLEELFRLGSLNQDDVAANPFDDLVDITQTPPAFTPITSVQAAYVPGPEPTGFVARPTRGFDAKGHPDADMLARERDIYRTSGRHAAPPPTHGYFRVIPADYMRPGPDGRFSTYVDDWYGSRSADY